MVKSRTPETTLWAEHFCVLLGTLQPLGRSALSTLYLLWGVPHEPGRRAGGDKALARPRGNGAHATQLRPTHVLLLEYSQREAGHQPPGTHHRHLTHSTNEAPDAPTHAAGSTLND